MTAYTAVLLYVLWMITLALFYAAPRVPLGLLGKKPIDSWERNKPPVDPPFMQRAKSAHMNCIENLPLFLAVVAVAALMGQIDVVNAIAAWVVGLRVAQGLLHIAGTSMALILARATCFVAQVALIACAAIQLL